MMSCNPKIPGIIARNSSRIYKLLSIKTRCPDGSDSCRCGSVSCSYLVAFSNPKPRFEEASAWRQPTVVPPPPGVVRHAPDELAARRHQVLHSTYELHSHAEPPPIPRRPVSSTDDTSLLQHGPTLFSLRSNKLKAASTSFLAQHTRSHTYSRVCLPS